jgi:hypothetical protein
VLGCDFLGNQPNDSGVDLEFLEVDGGNALLLRDEIREIILVQVAEFGDLSAQTRALRASVIPRLPQLISGEQVLLDEEFPNLIVH